MSLLIRNCRTLEHEGKVDILIESDKVAEVDEMINERAQEEIDAAGNLVLPTFIEPHVHLDKAFLAEKIPEAKSISEARSLVREAKTRFTKQDVAERAERCIRMALMNGVTYIRTHVDIDSITNFKSLDALLELREKYRELVTIQIVAFPQEGIFKDENGYELIAGALERGADVVGGLPEAELNKEDGKRHIEKLTSLASQMKVHVDMHIDVQPSTNYVESFISEVARHNLGSRATADHLIALAYYESDYASKIISMLKEHAINVVSNPCTMMVGGGVEKGPLARGVTRIKEMLASGVNIVFGLDNVVDPYNPFGDFDPLRNAWLFAYAGQLNSNSEITKLIKMPTYSSSKVLGLSSYGLQKGCRADINVLNTSSVRDAIRLDSKPVYVIRSGKVIVSRKEEASSRIGF